MRSDLDYLVVEDDHHLARCMTRALAPLGRACTASSLAEAAAILGAHLPPLGIVVDEQLPDGSGSTWLGVRRASGWRGTGLVTAGNPVADVQARAVQLGACFVAKPFGEEVLAAFAANAATPTNRMARALALMAAAALLTPREQEILELFAHGTQRSDLAAHLRLSENTVKRMIRHLLEKLELRGASLSAALSLVMSIVNSTTLEEARRACPSLERLFRRAEAREHAHPTALRARSSHS